MCTYAHTGKLIYCPHGRHINIKQQTACLAVSWPTVIHWKTLHSQDYQCYNARAINSRIDHHLETLDNYIYKRGRKEKKPFIVQLGLNYRFKA